MLTALNNWTLNTGGCTAELCRMYFVWGLVKTALNFLEKFEENNHAFPLSIPYTNSRWEDRECTHMKQGVQRTKHKRFILRGVRETIAAVEEQ